MNYGKIAVGIVIVAVSSWIIIGEQIAKASSNAFVNASIVSIRSPIAGTIDNFDIEIGKQIELGQELVVVADSLLSSERISNLEIERSRVESRIDAIRSRATMLSAANQKMADRTVQYQNSRLEELETRLNRARIRLGILRGEGSLPTQAYRIADVVDDQSSRLPGEAPLPALVLEYAEERVEALENELRTTRNGVYIGDGYNDAPYSEQTQNHLSLEIRDLEILLEEHLDQKTYLDLQLSRESAHFVRSRTVTLSSPLNGIIWRVINADGVYVQPGDHVLQLVDCDSTIVSLSVSKSIYNSISVGQNATFRFENDSQVFDGFISRLAGSGAEDVFSELAVAPSPKHLEQYDVTLVVPELRKRTDFGCAIGRTGRVFFEARPFDRIRNVFR